VGLAKQLAGTGVWTLTMRKIITLATAAFLVVSTTAAFAQGPARGAGNPAKAEHHQMMHKMMEQLNLSKGQKDQLKGIHEQTKARMMAIKSSNASADQKKAEAKELHKRSREKMMSVLTPAQKQKFEAMRAEMKAKHGGGKFGK
jgi:Spy/CpxP family protein refolding chaperone